MPTLNGFKYNQEHHLRMTTLPSSISLSFLLVSYYGSVPTFMHAFDQVGRVKNFVSVICHSFKYRKCHHAHLECVGFSEFVCKRLAL